MYTALIVKGENSHIQTHRNECKKSYAATNSYQRKVWTKKKTTYYYNGVQNFVYLYDKYLEEYLQFPFRETLICLVF